MFGLTYYWHVHLLEGLTPEEFRRKRAMENDPTKPRAYHDERRAFYDRIHAMPAVAIGTTHRDGSWGDITVLDDGPRSWLDTLVADVGEGVRPIEDILTDDAIERINRISVLRFREKHAGRLAFLHAH